MREIRYLPAHCLECRVQEGAGTCDFCKARWQKIRENLQMVVIGLADFMKKEKARAKGVTG